MDKDRKTPHWDYHVCVVDRDGTCVLNPRVPQMHGTKPWEWCREEDQAGCREAFIDACMFRRPRLNLRYGVSFDGVGVKLADFHLHPLSTGQVLCVVRRVFEAELSSREKEVLMLLSGGASADQIAATLGVTESTARDHMAGVKRKLGVSDRESLLAAAHQLSLRREGPELLDGEAASSP